MEIRIKNNTKWFSINKGYFPFFKIVKFRCYNHIDLHIFGLKINWSMSKLDVEV